MKHSVGKVWWPDFSTFIQTNWKSLKSAKLKTKNLIPSMIFLFSYNILLLSQRIQNELKNKMYLFFLQVIIWHALHTRILWIFMLQQMTKVIRILWHVANIITWLRHAYNFPNKVGTFAQCNLCDIYFSIYFWHSGIVKLYLCQVMLCWKKSNDGMWLFSFHSSYALQSCVSSFLDL